MSKHSGPLMEKLCRAIGSTKKNWLYGKNPHLYEVLIRYRYKLKEYNKFVKYL